MNQNLGYQNINDSFNNNEFLLWLPPISTITYSELDHIYWDLRNTNFVESLTSLLNRLNKENYMYKFDFSLFLHTNNVNIETVYLLPPISGLPDFESINPEKMFIMMFLHQFWTKFKYHGYHLYLSESSELENIEEIGEFVHFIHSKLFEKGDNVNPEFVELNRSVLLKITRINKY